VDGVGVALAAFGMLNPLLAALIHVGSELAFILNSARLLAGVAKGADAGFLRPDSRKKQEPLATKYYLV
jgi:hypothetical protein